MALLRAMLGEALAGDVRFALLEGEAGIGKTRLLEEVASLANRERGTSGVGSLRGRRGRPRLLALARGVRTLHADGALGELPPELAACSTQPPRRTTSPPTPRGSGSSRSSPLPW
jgi:hypothetical protein